MTKPTDEALQSQLLEAYRNGYLQEDILERAIIAIARHYARSQGDAVREWLIGGLLLTAGLALLLWMPRYGFREKLSVPTSPSSSILQKVPALTIAAPNLLDDSPPGAYDFTLIDRKNQTQNVPVPAPCSGVIKKTRFQGQTGNLQTGWGGGNLLDLECNGSRYGWRMAHFAALWVKPGQRVKEGDGIGGQGCTGRCSGDHVHAQIHRLQTWQRLEDRTFTAPLVDQYFAKVRRGWQ